MGRFTTIAGLMTLGLWGVAGVVASQAVPPPAELGTKEVIDALEKAFKERHPPSAITALEKAVQAIKDRKRPARDKQHILKAMTAGVDNKNVQVSLKTVEFLGRVGPPAAKPLARALRAKKVEKNPALLKAVIDSLGYTQDEKTAVRALLGVVNAYKDWKVRAWAGGALANFDKSVARGVTRKRICEKLIQIYEGIQSQAADGRDSDAIRKLNAIRGDFVATLRTLTEQEFNSSLDWRKWFNKAKKRRKAWPDPPKKPKGAG